MCTHTSKPKQEFMLVLYANNISDYVNGIILISTKSFPIWVRRSLIINKIIHCLVAARAKLVLSWQIFCFKNWPNAYLYMKYFFPLERQTWFLPGGVETAQTVGPKQAMKLAERGLFFHLSIVDSFVAASSCTSLLLRKILPYGSVRNLCPLGAPWTANTNTRQCSFSWEDRLTLATRIFLSQEMPSASLFPSIQNPPSISSQVCDKHSGGTTFFSVSHDASQWSVFLTVTKTLSCWPKKGSVT